MQHLYDLTVSNHKELCFAMSALVCSCGMCSNRRRCVRWLDMRDALAVSRGIHTFSPGTFGAWFAVLMILLTCWTTVIR